MNHGTAESGRSGQAGKRDSKGMRMGDPLLAPSQGILGKHPSKQPFSAAVKDWLPAHLISPVVLACWLGEEGQERVCSLSLPGTCLLIGIYLPVAKAMESPYPSTHSEGGL